MSDNFAISEKIILEEKRNVDRSVGPLLKQLGHENTLLPETPLRIVQQVIKIWQNGGRQVITVISHLPFIPGNWRLVINAIINALDAASRPDVIGEIAKKFKAGRDL